MNVALYRAGRDRWAMTERGRVSLAQARDRLTIGPSSLHWDGDSLTIQIDEWTAPFPSRMRGTVVLRPEAISEPSFALDTDGLHSWRPIAPRARVDVRFDDSDLAWCGDGYFDSNWGAEPLQRGFRKWTWSRAHTPAGTQIHYDVTPRTGADRSLALRFDRLGVASSIEPTPCVSLANTFWCMSRTARCLGAAAPRLERTLEDTPFYARSLLAGDNADEPAHIMHESLSLDRFRTPIVQAMLPFRMPRIVRRR